MTVVELLKHAERVRRAALGFDVRRLRAQGMTQAEVARVLGVNRSTVSRRERFWGVRS